MQQAYTEDLLKVRDEYKHTRKLTLWCLIGGIVGMIIAISISSLIWDHWILQVISFALFIPFFYMLIKEAHVESKLKKLLPKREYLQIQENEKTFKRLSGLFVAMGIFSFLSILAMVTVSFLHDKEWITFQIENYTLIAMFAALSCLGFISAWSYANELRKQYLTAKEKEPN